MKEEQILVYYPTWMKVLFYIAFPPLLIGMLYLLTLPIWEPGGKALEYIISSALALAVLYQCSIGLRCFSNLNTIIEIFDDGIDIHKDGDVTSHSWRDISVVNYAFATTYKISIDINGKNLYLSHSIPNIELLFSGIQNKGFRA